MIHPSHGSETRVALWSVGVLAVLLPIAALLPAPDQARGLAGYLPLHSILEVLSVAIAVLVFAVGWNTRHQYPSHNLLWLACLFLGVGALDLSHMLSFEGMPAFVTPGSAQKSIDFWLAARTMAAAALIGAALMPGTPWPLLPRVLLPVTVPLVVLALHVLFLYYPERVPATFVPGQGLTPFKIGFEYALIVTYLAAAFLFMLKLRLPRAFNASGLMAAALIMAMSEFFFTLYANVTDVYNLLGHLYKIAAYAFLYRALFVETVQRPYEQLAESRRQLSATIDALPDLLFEMDARGNYVDVHASDAAQLAGPAVELIGRNVRDVMSEAAAAACLQALDTARQAGISRGARIALDVPAGRRYFELSVARKHANASREPGFLVLARDVTELVEQEGALLHESQRNAALLGLPEVARTSDEKTFLRHGVEQAERLTDSRIAFVHFANDDQETIELCTWSSGTLAHYCTAAYDQHYPVSQAGIWAQAMRERKPVVFNDYASAAGRRGLPEGHAALERLISVPVMDGDKVRMIVGVGNKPVPYTERDVETVQLTANDLWRIASGQRAARRLSESESNLRTLLRSIPDVVYMKDARGAVLFCNAPFERLFGVTEAAVLGKTAFDLFDPELAEAFHRQDQLVMALNEPVTNEEWVTSAHDGRRVLFETIKTPVRTPDGEVLGVLGVSRDITERRQAQESLLQLSMAVEQSPESIVICDLDAQIEYANQSFLTITGYTREEVIGTNPRLLHSGRTPKATYDELWAALGRGEPWKGEFVNRRKDGSEYVEFAIIAPIRQPDGRITHYLAIKDDITEKKQLAEELEQHRHHLEALVRSRTEELADARERADSANQAKSAFLANMSHEIRTPMNAIIGLTYLLQSGAPRPDQMDRLGKIGASAQHLLGLINDILDLSKIEAGKLAVESVYFEPARVVEEAVQILRPRAEEKGLSLVLDVSPDCPVGAQGDALRLRQVLLNLGGNAVKFTDAGSVVVRVRVASGTDDAFSLRFEVADTGIGLTQEQQGRLFKAFEQGDSSTTRQYGGTGLGLIISKRMVELMGGSIGVDSEPGRGSTFWFVLPVVRARRERHAATDAPAATAGADLGAVGEARAPLQILLVEDDPINQEVASELLSSAGHQVTIAGDGAEALRRAAGAAFDLVLMDMQMPVMGGLEATRELRRMPGYDTTPILALTANAFGEDRQACLQAGMNDFIAKPVDPTLLFEKIARWGVARAPG